MVKTHLTRTKCSEDILFICTCIVVLTNGEFAFATTGIATECYSVRANNLIMGGYGFYS